MTINATEEVVEVITKDDTDITLVNQNRASIEAYLAGRHEPTNFRSFGYAIPRTIFNGMNGMEVVKQAELPEGNDPIFIGVRVVASQSLGAWSVDSGTRGELFRRLPTGHEQYETHFQPLTRMGTAQGDSTPAQYVMLAPTLEEGQLYAGISYGELVQMVNSVNGTPMCRTFAPGRGQLLGREQSMDLASPYFRVPMNSDYLPRIVKMTASEQEARDGMTQAERYEDTLSKIQAMGLERVADNTRILASKYYIVGGHPSSPQSWQYGMFDTDRDFHNRTAIDFITFGESGNPHNAQIKLNHETRGYSQTGTVAGLTIFEVPRNWLSMVSGKAPVAPGYGAGLGMPSMVSLLNGFATRLDTMNDALNEYADESEHCSEFEDSVMPLGFSGRESKNIVDWDVDVEVQFTYTESGLNSHDTSLMESITGVDNIQTGGEVTFSGTATVQVQIEGPRNADGEWIRERIDTSDVEGELTGDVEVTDWDVTDCNISE